MSLNHLCHSDLYDFFFLPAFMEHKVEILKNVLVALFHALTMI